MKISKSKQELARIISENGGWDTDWCFAAQDACGIVNAYERKPVFNAGNSGFGHGGGRFAAMFKAKKIANWHQSRLSRAEYFHLYHAPDADGWIEWKGGECPVDGDVNVKFWNGTIKENPISARELYWEHDGDISDIIAYRLHKPDAVKPTDFGAIGDAVTIPEYEIHSKNIDITQVDDINVVESKPTIEQMASDYRNAKDYADRKQQEADAAKADAEAKLSELVAAGKALGLVLSVVGAVSESELIITDWRDLQLDDVIWYAGDDELSYGEYYVMEIESPDYEGYRTVMVNGVNGGHWIDTRAGWGFIRRP